MNAVLAEPFRINLSGHFVILEVSDWIGVPHGVLSHADVVASEPVASIYAVRV
jgi:hypothetical protein